MTLINIWLTELNAEVLREQSKYVISFANGGDVRSKGFMTTNAKSMFQNN